MLTRKLDKISQMLDDLRPLGFLVLRIIVGMVMVSQGVLKIANFENFTGFLVNHGIPQAQLLAYFAVAAELVGGLGILLGFFTRVAALAIISTMTIAILYVHTQSSIIGNKSFEYPLVLWAISFFFFLNGAGAWSLDYIFSKMGILKENTKPKYVNAVAPW